MLGSLHLDPRFGDRGHRVCAAVAAAQSGLGQDERFLRLAEVVAKLLHFGFELRRTIHLGTAINCDIDARRVRSLVAIRARCAPERQDTRKREAQAPRDEREKTAQMERKPHLDLSDVSTTYRPAPTRLEATTTTIAESHKCVSDVGPSGGGGADTETLHPQAGS